jgi:hypothetical protein
MPVSDLVAPTVPASLPAELSSSWSTAITTLTDLELTALVLRFGFRTGKPESFGMVGGELGVNRVRAQAIFTNALGRLARMEETRALSRYLADLNAALGDGAQVVPTDPAGSEQPAAVQHLRRRAPVIEETRDETLTSGSDEDALEIDRGAPAIDAASSDAVASNGGAEHAADQGASSDEEVATDDKPVSEKDALKLVHAADRELARAIEQCVGREDLLAELQRARTRIAAGMREIEKKPTAPAAKQVSSPTGKRRGRPANVQEAARRAAVLKRVQAGELNNAAAAKGLGISDAAWAAWKSYYLKRTGGKKVTRRGRPTKATTAAQRPERPASPLAGLVAQLEGLRRFGEELRDRVRAMVELVDRRFPG